jgi:hypothetical protein
MDNSAAKSSQISETLADLSVRLADVEMPVSDLAGGVLVVGQTAAGKTKSIMNNLARQFAEMFTACGKTVREQRQFAIFYLGLKGLGHAEFFESLSASRREDVVVISHDKHCPWVVRLFKRHCWACTDELQLAVVSFVEEVAQRISRARFAYRHDPFWDRQRVRFVSELARLNLRPDSQPELLESSLSELMHDDALIALLARIDAFLAYVGEKRDPSSERKAAATSLREELKKHGFTQRNDLKRAEELVAHFARSPQNISRPKVRALCEFLLKQLQTARAAKAETSSRTLLEQFAAHLDAPSHQRLYQLLEQWWRIPDVTRGVIEADIRGVVEAFGSGPAEQVFRGKGKREITIEEVIDRGLIMIVDLPAGDSGAANWPVLVTLKLALTQRLIGRYTAKFNGRPLSRRGAVIVQDEAQLLLSESEAKALSVIREFGCVWLLATQALSLVASVLGNDADTAAFVASARVRIWGSTADEHTAAIASRFCGTSRGQPQRLACLWHPTPLLTAAVTGTGSVEKLLVAPERIYELETGQFYLRTADNETYFLDLRLSLPKPLSRNLRQLPDKSTSDSGLASRTR